MERGFACLASHVVESSLHVVEDSFILNEALTSLVRARPPCPMPPPTHAPLAFLTIFTWSTSTARDSLARKARARTPSLVILPDPPRGAAGAGRAPSLRVLFQGSAAPLRGRRRTARLLACALTFGSAAGPHQPRAWPGALILYFFHL